MGQLFGFLWFPGGSPTLSQPLFRPGLPGRHAILLPGALIGLRRKAHGAWGEDQDWGAVGEPVNVHRHLHRFAQAGGLMRGDFAGHAEGLLGRVLWEKQGKWMIMDDDQLYKSKTKKKCIWLIGCDWSAHWSVLISLPFYGFIQQDNLFKKGPESMRALRVATGCYRSTRQMSRSKLKPFVKRGPFQHKISGDSPNLARKVADVSGAAVHGDVVSWKLAGRVHGISLGANCQPGSV